ncbi:MAG: isoprenylcysteine carboxylmethyltransferase family protein [Pseudomonadota bacterium]
MPKQFDLPPVYLVIALIAVFILSWFGGFVGGFLGAGFWGSIITLTGLGLIGWSIFLFREYQTPLLPRQTAEALVMDGPYLVSRNPMYLGMVLIALGVGIFMGPVIAYIPAFVLAVYLDRNFIQGEEDALREAFASEANAYIDDTARWIGYGPVKL